ncbi:MAG TPA: TldD/PmbA family protein [Actinomycetota bacterium]|nr:TldD/PmbA family protein [Actinomycetota bacterium]
MLDESLVREILDVALSSGGSFAEVYAEERVSTSVRLDDRRVEELSTGTDRGAAVRVIAGETTGYAYSNRVEPEALRRAAEAAAAAVRGSERGRVIDLRRMEPPVRHPVANPAVEVPTERKVDWVREADDAARSHAPEVRQVVAGYGDSVQRLLIATSDGRWVEEERNRVRLIVNVVAARDGVMQTGFEGPAGLAGVELLEQHPPSEIARKAARQAIAMLDGRPAPAGEMAVVVGAAGGGVLFHEACGHGLEADTIGKEASVYRGRMGERLASGLVHGVDDATVPGAWGSFSFDDEGHPAERTTLFEGGTLVGALYDGTWSRRDGTPSTGNGRRQSYASVPIPRMTNTSILPGETDPEEIIRDTKRGLYAKALGGGQVNPATGDFVFGVSEAYLIEDGTITAPVRGANLIGNGIAIMQAVDAVGSDFDTRPGTCGKDGQSAPVTTGSPTLRIARMTVGGTGG